METVSQSHRTDRGVPNGQAAESQLDRPRSPNSTAEESQMGRPRSPKSTAEESQLGWPWSLKSTAEESQLGWPWSLEERRDDDVSADPLVRRGGGWRWRWRATIVQVRRRATTNARRRAPGEASVKARGKIRQRRSPTHERPADVDVGRMDSCGENRANRAGNDAGGAGEGKEAPSEGAG